MTPTLPGAVINRECVIVEWTDRNIANTAFEGTARELLRMQLASPIHPLGEMTFSPTARRGDPDWRVMYVTRGTTKPIYPVIAYRHISSGGDAIAGGFVYRGKRIPALRGKLLFADITTGHVWFAEMKEVLAADDGNPSTLAQIHEVDAGLRRLAEETFRVRGGRGNALPGTAAVAGRGRVDVRFAEDNAGELYLLTKSDGLIRQVAALQ